MREKDECRTAWQAHQVNEGYDESPESRAEAGWDREKLSWRTTSGSHSPVKLYLVEKHKSDVWFFPWPWMHIEFDSEGSALLLPDTLTCSSGWMSLRTILSPRTQGREHAHAHLIMAAILENPSRKELFRKICLICTTETKCTRTKLGTFQSKKTSCLSFLFLTTESSMWLVSSRIQWYSSVVRH